MFQEYEDRIATYKKISSLRTGTMFQDWGDSNTTYQNNVSKLKSVPSTTNNLNTSQLQLHIL